MFLKTVIEVIY